MDIKTLVQISQNFSVLSASGNLPECPAIAIFDCSGLPFGLDVQAFPLSVMRELFIVACDWVACESLEAKLCAAEVRTG